MKFCPNCHKPVNDLPAFWFGILLALFSFTLLVFFYGRISVFSSDNDSGNGVIYLSPIVITGKTPKNTKKQLINSAFLNALIATEGAKTNKTVGDSGDAKGILQIHECVIEDVNNFYGFHYVHNDAFNPVLAIRICTYYLRYWGRVYLKKTEKEPTQEVLARIWNGGPNGYKKSSTDKYWAKVKKHLLERSH